MNKNNNIDDLINELNNASEDGSNLVRRAVSDTIKNDAGINLTSAFTKIPLEMIEFREENNYSIRGIEKLAKDIYEVGQIMPVVVKAKDGGKKYVLSDGERRVRAIILCKKMAEEANDKKKIKEFSFVRCRILSAEEEKREEQIHNSANIQRINTIFEIIARYNPKEDSEYFGIDNSNANRKSYIVRKYGEDGWTKYLNNELNVKWNQSSVVDDIYLKFCDDYPEYEISSNSVKNYSGLVIKLTPEAIKFINNESSKCGHKEINYIASLSKEDQIAFVRQYTNDDGTYNAFNYQKPSAKKVSDDLESPVVNFQEAVVKTGSKLKSINNWYNSLFNDTLKEDKKDLVNGNSREYYKQLKKVLKEIEKLNEMSVK